MICWAVGSQGDKVVASQQQSTAGVVGACTSLPIRAINVCQLETQICDMLHGAGEKLCMAIVLRGPALDSGATLTVGARVVGRVLMCEVMSCAS